jgi:hypothetical protein
VHFGLGANRLIRELEIVWPSRIRQVLHDLEVDRVMTIEEPRHASSSVTIKIGHA